MAQGRLDQVSPADAAVRYAETLTAASKELVWFERSAHMPQFEEPAKSGTSSCGAAAGDDVAVNDQLGRRP